MKGLLPKKPQDEGTMTDEFLTRNGLKKINSYLYLHLIAVLIIVISGIINPVTLVLKHGDLNFHQRKRIRAVIMVLNSLLKGLALESHVHFMIDVGGPVRLKARLH